MSNQFKTKIREQLVVAAKSYYFLLDKSIILKSSEFKNQSTYILNFSKTNFLHLTGVITELQPTLFFEKCLNETIDENDFTYNDVKNKNTIKVKLRNLVNINSFFNKPIYVQEVFKKNKIICRIATADNKCTIGFTGGKINLYPNTLLNNNHLVITDKIIEIKPIVSIKSE